MKDKENFDVYIEEELKKTYSSPVDINKNLILNVNRKKEGSNLINLIFFIISLIQSISVVLVGVIFLSDIVLKIFIVGIGIFLFNLSISIFAIILSKEGVLI